MRLNFPVSLLTFWWLTDTIVFLIVRHAKWLHLLLQMVSLIIEAVAWCSMLIMICLETKFYIREFRWYVRFGVIYVLVGDAVILNLIIPMRDYYSRLVFLLLTKLFTKVYFAFPSTCFVFLLKPQHQWNW